MSILLTATLVSAFSALAAAHGTVSGIVADGVYTEGWHLSNYYVIQNGHTPPETPGWYAEDLDNGFVSPDSYTAPDIICHKNAKQLATTTSATVAAGGTVDFEWTVWPDSHVGPVITYVANCGGDCAAVDKTDLAWVKIDAAGYDEDTKTWASTKLIANNNTWTTTVPSSLKAGNYVFRHEIIALHSANNENGAQNYPQCLNIAITGDGTATPAGTVGTALYTPTEPGILVNVYYGLTNYTIPGPALFTDSDASASSPAPAASSAASSSPAPAASSAAASSVAPVASSAAASSPAASLTSTTTPPPPPPMTTTTSTAVAATSTSDASEPCVDEVVVDVTVTATATAIATAMEIAMTFVTVVATARR